MTARNRVKDLLPIMIVFFAISVIGTLMFFEYVVNDPVGTSARNAASHPAPFLPDH